jgi:hypothetical protein
MTEPITQWRVSRVLLRVGSVRLGITVASSIPEGNCSRLKDNFAKQTIGSENILPEDKLE